MYSIYNIKEYRLKLISLYSLLDIFLDANPEILITLDNSDNLYFYSDKVKLFDALEMLENKYTNLSLIDLKIRCLNYSIDQHQILKKFIIHQKNKPSDELFKAMNIANDINITLRNFIQFLISPEDLHSMPEYLLNLMSEYKLYKVEE